MVKIFWSVVKLSPAILTLMVGTNVGAETVLQNLSHSAPEITIDASFETDSYQINVSTDETSDRLAQITSVSQLSDVQPTDWAFQALQSLVERYGIIAGYPDGTFRGNRPMTRYEFAAALDVASNQIVEIIARGLDGRLYQEDLATLERLRTDFTTELATVKTRLDTLESRTAQLEANQFSTTTKLTAIVSFNVAAATAGEDIKVERIDPENIFSAAQRGTDGKPIVTRVESAPNITFSNAVGLFLTTSFSGKDTLATTLVMGNGFSPVNTYTSAGFFNTYGVPVLDLTPSVVPNDVVLAEVLYSFPINKSVQVAIGPQFFWFRYFDTNVFTSAFGRGASSFNTYGSTLVNSLARGAGTVLLWRINEQFDLRFGYVATPNASDPTRGLFNGTRAVTAQLTYSPISTINLRFIYDHSKIRPSDGQIISTRPILGVADDGFGGALEDATADTFGFNFDWSVTPKFGIFGRYTYATTRLNPTTSSLSEGNIKAQAIQIGLAFPDLGRRGALATLSYVIPYDVLDGRRFLVSGGGDGGTEFDIEVTYYMPLTDNIAIVPIFHVIGNPNNFDDNPTIYTGTVRGQFTF